MAKEPKKQETTVPDTEKSSDRIELEKFKGARLIEHMRSIIRELQIHGSEEFLIESAAIVHDALVAEYNAKYTPAPGSASGKVEVPPDAENPIPDPDNP